MPESARLKVLALVTDAWNGRGGIARYNRDLLGAVAEMPTVERVCVLARHVPDTSEKLPQGVEMVHAVAKARFVAQAFRSCLAMKPDVLFCGHLHFAPLAAILARLFSVPMWLQVHGIEAWEQPGRLRRWATERSSLLTAVSRYTRRRVLGWARLPINSARVLANTVEPRFTPGPRRSDLVERLGLTGRRLLLTVARLSEQERYKGHERVMQAMGILADEHPDLSYLVVGEGGDRPRLEALAGELGLTDRVVFVGAVGGEELPEYYRLADVFVMPSTGEGFGIAFLEAAACGIPVIACDAAGSPDALRDGAVGLLCENSPGSVASAIKQSLGEPNHPLRALAPFEYPRFRSRAQMLMSRLSLQAVS